MKPLGSARSGAARLADGALELTVAGGFGSPGIRLRRRMFSWEELPGMQGRRVLITGATSGIGRAAALQMAGLGAEVAIIGRDPERTRSTAQEIAEAGAGPRPGAGYFLADLRLLSDARRVADEIIGEGQVWDVLIHNAGALVRTYERTSEGFEATYASQVLSQHVLTTRLLPVLARGTDPRVIVVSSGGMYAEKLDLDTVQMSADGYDGVRAYARAKRAQVALNQQWAARFSEAVWSSTACIRVGRTPRGCRTHFLRSVESHKPSFEHRRRAPTPASGSRHQRRCRRRAAPSGLIDGRGEPCACPARPRIRQMVRGCGSSCASRPASGRAATSDR